MATGGFKPNATTDFLEEWKAKREKMRAKMLGEIAAVSGAPLATSAANSSGRHAAPPAAAELPTGPERSANCLPPSYPVARSSSGTALKEETHHAGAPAGSNPKKAPSQPERAQCGSPDPSSAGGHDMDKESPSPSKAKEKNSSGPSARKGKGQIEKRKLREKRRSTGVVSIPSNEVCDVGLVYEARRQSRGGSGELRGRGWTSRAAGVGFLFDAEAGSVPQKQLLLRNAELFPAAPPASFTRGSAGQRETLNPWRRLGGSVTLGGGETFSMAVSRSSLPLLRGLNLRLWPPERFMAKETRPSSVTDWTFMLL
ncbi:hypothetical protein D4764_22G0005050 [Takifugu flavidus]|uniref:PRKC apoptosis WT1 regulator protein n=1 Tax=Takifugu flavidus TaxID=433684 RepID=A0A5C6ND67_9TELE|nr:hypothetical protein D4764_22G0005050 [Takifugu flavidus]